MVHKSGESIHVLVISGTTCFYVYMSIRFDIRAMMQGQSCENFRIISWPIPRKQVNGKYRFRDMYGIYVLEKWVVLPTYFLEKKPKYVKQVAKYISIHDVKEFFKLEKAWF